MGLISNQGSWQDDCVTHWARAPLGGPDVWGLDLRVFLGHTQFEVPVRWLSGCVTRAVVCLGREIGQGYNCGSHWQENGY